MPALDLDRQLTREWLLTNGRGGFASGTTLGINTRRYHGLLVAAARPPLERWMLLSNVLEKITVDGNGVELASFQFDQAIHPRGYEHLHGFETSNHREGPWAEFAYSFEGGRVTKRIMLPRGRDEVRIGYQVDASPGAQVTVELLPFVAMRDFHHLTQHFEGGFPVDTCKAAAIVHAWRGGPRLWMGGRSETDDRVMQFESRPDWWRGFLYREEAQRGQDCREDLFVPGWFRMEGKGGLGVTLVARALFQADQGGKQEWQQEGGAQSPASPSKDESSVGEWVSGRVGDMGKPNSSPSRPLASSPSLSSGAVPVEHRLLEAADAFVVTRRRADGRDSKTIIAGYHWFGDWGRDTFIAMPGLLFETLRFDEAREILETFASVQRNGLIPNRFTDYGEGCDYNSVDASLWYLFSATRYFELTSDGESWARTLYPACRRIVDHFQKGTEFSIRADSDGLVTAGDEKTQLTWMDAKFGETVFTPRNGKPVEINALWYHGLRMLEKLCLQNAPEDAGWYDKLADKVEASFVPAFWNAHANCLYDVVGSGQASSSSSGGRDVRSSGAGGQDARSPDGEQDSRPPSTMADAAIRPNQIFAASLPHTPLSLAQRQLVVDCVRDHLLTPYGLRSLSPKDRAYRPRCEGNPFERDSAYHQGTVWGWLIGPYVEAYLRVNEFAPKAKAEMRNHLAALITHLDEAGLGSVSEIFDGDPPHTPRGCIAQAWSVSELLRAWRMTA